MDNQNYNNDFNQNPNQGISKKLLTIIFLGAVVFSFFLGFMFNVVTKVDLTPRLQLENNKPQTKEGKVYDDLYKFLEENYYKPVDKDQAFYYQLTSLVESLNDPYTQVSLLAITPGISNSNITDYDEEHFEGLGVSFVYENYVMVINSVMRHSPAERAYIYPGDRIIGVVYQGKQLIFETEQLSQEDAIPYVRGVGGDQKTFIIKGLDDSVRTVTVTYERFARPTVTSNKDDIQANYGYIKIHEFAEKTALVFTEHLQLIEQKWTDPNTQKIDSNKTLIIDLRDNPGGLLTSIVPIMKQFITEDNMKVIGIKAEKSGKTFYYGGGISEKKPYNIKVLVNNESASASEMLAAALHYFGGYEVYGTETFGKNIYQTTVTIPISDQLLLSLKYTEGYWFYGEGNIMDKDTNPIPVNVILPTGYLTLEIPFYTGDVSLDQVNIGLQSAQKFLNIYNPLLNLREDGYLDLATEQALKTFQDDHSIKRTGKYDLRTSQAMYRDYILKLENHLYDNQIQALIS